MSKTFCPIPWNSVNMINNGDFRVCCNSDYKDRIGTRLKKENGDLYNAGKDDWNEVRNSPLVKEVRKTILDGKWHSECERCRQEELSGVGSYRQKHVNDWSKWFGNRIDYNKALASTKTDGTLDTNQIPIDQIDIRYGNFCNLKCRMCGPHDSHMWYDDYEKLHGKTRFEDHDWFSNNENYKINFEKYGFNAHKLYFIGGEPLIIEEHKQSLKEIIESGKADTIRLEYNTNLTSVSDELIEIWKHFKEIRIAASIDGFGKVFNYQRHPANFNKVSEIISKLDTTSDLNIRLWFHLTVTSLNVFHVPEFIKWKLENQFKRWNKEDSPSPTISYHLCHTPEYYSIKILPIDLKNKIQNHYNDYIIWMENSSYSDNIKHDFKKKCQAILNYMNSEDYSQYLNQFINITKRLDLIRKQNITDVVPQYQHLFVE